MYFQIEQQWDVVERIYRPILTVIYWIVKLD